MMNELANENKVPMLINVPYIAGRRFSKKMLEIAKEERDYHNSRLSVYAKKRNVLIADICSLLKDEIGESQAMSAIIQRFKPFSAT